MILLVVTPRAGRYEAVRMGRDDEYPIEPNAKEGWANKGFFVDVVYNGEPMDRNEILTLTEAISRLSFRANTGA